MLKNAKRRPQAMDRFCQVKWRTTEEEFEYFARTIHPKTVQESEIKKWFPKDWRERLAALRKEQRAEGVPDSNFQYGKRAA